MYRKSVTLGHSDLRDSDVYFVRAEPDMVAFVHAIQFRQAAMFAGHCPSFACFYHNPGMCRGEYQKWFANRYGNRACASLDCRTRVQLERSRFRLSKNTVRCHALRHVRPRAILQVAEDWNESQDENNTIGNGQEIHANANADSSSDSKLSGVNSRGTFEEIYKGRIPDWLLDRMKDLGFHRPMDVQMRTLSATLGRAGEQQYELGQDAVIHAQTGSGKTLAYLLPAITAVDPTRASVQALILVPTQELGMQVYKMLRRLTVAWAHSAGVATGNSAQGNGISGSNNSHSSAVKEDDGREKEAWNDLEASGLGSAELDDMIFEDAESVNYSSTTDSDAARQHFAVLPMLNQADFRRQKLQLRRTVPRMVVGNPARIAELVESGRLRLDLLRVLVVDEFDSCLLDTATTAALQSVLSVRGRERRQTILASATVPQHRHFLRQCVQNRWTSANIEHVWIDEDSREHIPVSLRHVFAVCDSRKKLSALRMLLQHFGRLQGTCGLPQRSIVFVMQSRSVDQLVSIMNDALRRSLGLKVGDKPVVGLWNELSIGERRRGMRRFRSGDARVLIATDVAARGLDIPDVSHIFHLDLPKDADGYLHRAGRAGREGRPGTSVMLISPGEEFVIRRFENSLHIDFDIFRSNECKISQIRN